MSNKIIDVNALSVYKTNADAKYQDKLTAGNGITIDNNVVSAVSTFASPSLAGTTTVPNATTTSLGSLTLAPGNYILMFVCQFSSNASGYRRCYMKPSDAAEYYNDYRKAVNGTLTPTSIFAMFSVSATDYPNGRTYEFYARQNSGSSRTAYPRCAYIKF